MGDDIQNMKSTAEDRAVERAEQQLADPSALNMQFLQSTLNTSEFDGLSANSGFPGSAAKSQLHQSNPSGGGFSGSPAVVRDRVVMASDDGVVWCFGQH